MKKNMFVIAIITLIIVINGCGTTSTLSNSNVSENSSDSIIPNLKTVEEVITWCEENLYYKNVDSWDPAPKIEKVFKDGYGDCKMLAGAVSVLLDSVGKENLIIVIKKDYWHMFNAYKENDVWYVVNNADLVKKTFNSFDEIKMHYGVTNFVRTFTSYKDFRRWFNNEVYYKRNKR